MPVSEDRSKTADASDAEAAVQERGEEYLLTESEAQLAATLALMTGFSQGCCAAHRAPMAARVAEQLAGMAHGAALSKDMQAFLLRLCQRWSVVADALDAESAAQQREADAPDERPIGIGTHHHTATHSMGQATAHDDFPPSRVHWHASPETLQ